MREKNMGQPHGARCQCNRYNETEGYRFCGLRDKHDQFSEKKIGFTISDES